MGARTWPNLTSALLRGEELESADTAWAMGEIIAGNATPVQIAGFAMALRAKGETPGELAGLVEAMLANATLVELPEKTRTDAVDVVGTGGDRANTVNISTMAAIITAAAGVTVVKHGNRSASSTTGTADLLEHFGIPLDLGPDGVCRTVELHQDPAPGGEGGEVVAPSLRPHVAQADRGVGRHQPHARAQRRGPVAHFDDPERHRSGGVRP